MELYKLTAHELLDKFKNKEISSGELISAVYERIKNKDSLVKAYVRLDNHSDVLSVPVKSNEQTIYGSVVAVNHSATSANLTLSGRREPKGQMGYIPGGSPRPLNFDAPQVAAGSIHSAGILSGIPVAIKDNICTEGLNTECCSKILAGFQPPYDAGVIKKLKEAGAVILDIKTNMDEFAFGSSTENSCFGPTHNPWNLDCVPGGSSGGSAAAVASDETILAIGSDTGGSIRQPAAFCGVVGMKPTYGRVSRYGLIAFASSLDQIGPFAKDIHDCCLLMNVISGYDPMDSTSSEMAVPDYTQALGKDIKGLKIGIPQEYFVAGMNLEVKKIVQDAIAKLESLGATVQPVSLARTKYAVSVYYIIGTAEASSNLARFDGAQYGFRAKSSKLIEMYKRTRGEGFGQEAKRRILLGTFSLAHGYYDAYYLRALKVRALIKNDFDAVFKEFDCIITPTAPTAAFKIGEKSEDPLQMYLSDIYTISANLAGIPAISIPCGFTNNHLPVGLQILTKHFAEETLFTVGHAYEQATEWHKMKPSLKT